jgi:hypothetical protein
MRIAEILRFCTPTTAVIALAKSIFDLIAAILKGRSESAKKRDGASESLELVVRRVDERSGIREEIVFSARPLWSVDHEQAEPTQSEMNRAPTGNVKRHSSPKRARRGRPDSITGASD